MSSTLRDILLNLPAKSSFSSLPELASTSVTNDAIQLDFARDCEPSQFQSHRRVVLSKKAQPDPPGFVIGFQRDIGGCLRLRRLGLRTASNRCKDKTELNKILLENIEFLICAKYTL